MYASIDWFFLIPLDASGILYFSSLAANLSLHTVSLAISHWPKWSPYLYLWRHTLHTLLKPFRCINLHSGSHSSAALILRMRESPTKSSYAQTNRLYQSKNPRGQNEDSGRVNLTLRNLSKPQSSKIISASARQSRKPSPSSDCNALQEPTL